MNPNYTLTLQTQLRRWFLLLAFFSLAYFLIACSKSPSSPLAVQASIFPDPVVGREVTLQVEMSSSREETLPDTTLKIELPKEIEVVKGETEWHGEIPVGQTVVVNLQIKVLQEGEWIVRSRAFSDFGNGYGFGDGKTLYLTTFNDKASVEVDRTPPPPPQVQIAPPGGTLILQTNTPQPRVP